MRKSWGVLLLVMALPLHADEGDKRPVAFAADAKVSIDATGKLIKVEASPDLPDAIRAYIEQRVSTWTFAPPQHDGIVSNGMTYLRLGACAVPTDGDGYSLAMDYKGIGPGIPNGRLQPPIFPIKAAIAGQQASMKATYVVETDGHLTLESLEFTGNKPNLARVEFEKAVKSWIKAQHFMPEELEGRPIRTRMAETFDFQLADADEEVGKGRDQLQKERDARIRQSNECRMAGNPQQDDLIPIAEDSPFKLINQGS